MRTVYKSTYLIVAQVHKVGAKLKGYGPQQLPLSSELGDIFWGMAPYVTYIAGAEIGVTIYVANPSDEDKEYSLLARLHDANGQLILEEAIPIYGYAWFPVSAGDFVKIQAELQYEVSNVILTVVLVERSTGTEVNSVSTYLIAPIASQVPPAWGGTGVTTGFDMSSMMMFMMMIMMMAMVTSSFKGNNKEQKVIEGEYYYEGEQRKLLNAG